VAATLQSPTTEAAPARALPSLWRRSLLGIGTVAVMALVISLAAVLDLVDADVAVEACIGLAVIGAVSIGVARTHYNERFSDATFVTAQMAAVFLLLAWLTIRAEDTPAAISVLYLVAMLYGVLQLDRARLSALAAIALVTHGAAIFVLIGQGAKIDRAATWMQYGALVLALAWFTFAAGIVLRLRARLAEANRRVQELAQQGEERARRDSLTGVFHYHHMIETLDREVARADRLKKPLCVARIDLDGLRRINEARGHEAGDAALKAFVTAALTALRTVDVLGRYGGNEFVALLPDTDIRGAIVAAGRIHAAVAHAGSLTCTIGVAEHARGGNSRAAIARAESALNFAKAAGRDRLVALGPGGERIELEAL